MGAGRDLYGLRKDGSEFPIEIGLGPIETEGRQMVLAIVIDITERKRAEERLVVALGETERERARAELFARQRETMFTELQHRVSNNLQLVSAMLRLESAAVADERAGRALANASQRLALIGKLHRKLHDPGGAGVDFGVFLKEVCNDILSTSGTQGIECLVTSTALMLPLEKSIPLALIATELVSNAIEHGLAGRSGGKIAVGLEKDSQGQITLTVADNGKGLPAGFDAGSSENLGLRFVKALTQQLEGSFEIVDGRGVTCRLVIPVQETKERSGSEGEHSTPELIQ